VEPEVEMESGNKLVVDCQALVAGFSEVQENSNSQDESREEHRDGVKEVKMAEVLPDVRTDHPTSTLGVQCNKENIQPARFSRAKQEVPESVAELDMEELNEDVGKSDVQVQRMAGPGSVEPIEEWSNERQRPTRATRRPTRFRDSEFETQFRPEESRKRCNRLGRGDQARDNANKFYSFYEHRKQKEQYNHLGRGDQQSAARRKTDSSTQSPSPIQRHGSCQHIKIDQTKKAGNRC